jgi:hypothetical protein
LLGAGDYLVDVETHSRAPDIERQNYIVSNSTVMFSLTPEPSGIARCGGRE